FARGGTFVAMRVLSQLQHGRPRLWPRATTMQIVIPEIGHNIEEAEILALLVSVGEHVRAAQPVLELEADKASFELPSPAAGRIEQIYVDIGDDVKVGDVVLVLEPAAARESSPDRDNTAAPEPAVSEPERRRPVPYIRASP